MSDSFALEYVRFMFSCKIDFCIVFVFWVFVRMPLVEVENDLKTDKTDRLSDRQKMGTKNRSRAGGERC
jgi:hypothetical protein